MDEKTGIQALERLQQRAPLSKGHHQRNEFEYVRHGTTTLMAAYSVASGSIIYHQLNLVFPRKSGGMEKSTFDHPNHQV